MALTDGGTHALMALSLGGNALICRCADGGNARVSGKTAELADSGRAESRSPASPGVR